VEDRQLEREQERGQQIDSVCEREVCQFVSEREACWFVRVYAREVC